MLDTIYLPLLLAHNYLQWLVLAAAGGAAAVVAAGWARGLPWRPVARRAGLIYAIALDTQVTLGLALYGVSPLVRMVWSSLAEATRTPELRFFAFTHLLVMLAAAALAHTGSILARRAAADADRYRRAALCYTLSLALLLAGTPWWRPLLRGFW